MIDISFKKDVGNNASSLSVVLGKGNIFYAIIDNQNTIVECQLINDADYSDEDFINRYSDYFQKYKHLPAKVAFTTRPYLHSPAGTNGELLKFFPAFSNKTVDSDIMTAQDIVVNFGVPKSIYQFVRKVFGGQAKIFHISTVLSNFFFPFREKKIIAFIEDSSIHLLYGDNMEFKYYNQFECQTKEDYLYFISLIYKLHGLDLHNHTLFLSGRIEEDSDLYDLLHGYVKDIRMTGISNFSIGDEKFSNRPQLFNDVVATAQCV